MIFSGFHRCATIGSAGICKVFRWRPGIELLETFVQQKNQIPTARCNSSATVPSTYPAQPSATGFENYDAEYKQFKSEVPEYFNFAEDVLQHWCSQEEKGLRQSPHPALWWIDDAGNEIQWSFKDLLEEANRVANVLSDVCQIKCGDCVIVILPRIPDWWLVNIACLKLGAILSPGTTSLTAKDIYNRLQTSKAVSVITVPEVAASVEQVASSCPSLRSKVIVCKDDKKVVPNWIPLKTLAKQAGTNHKCVKTRSDDPMSWFFTSGTTGLPKMTEHTHASYGLAHRFTGQYWLDLTQSDVMWNLSDTGWAKSAYSSFYAPWWQGSCVFIHHATQFNAKRTLDILHSYPISVTCLPPTAYRMIVLEDMKSDKFKTLRHCVSAGEPLNPEVIEKWYASSGLMIREGYGQTETTVLCGMFSCLPVKPGSMGKPAPGYDIQILDDNHEPVAANVEGEVAIRCKPQRPIGLFTRYVNDDQRTNAVFHGDFYLTGDRASKDEDGYIWFVGRSDDVIISSGYRIGPFEVESVLIEHPAVVESAVISSPCDIRGEIVKACVVLTDDYINADQSELTKELQEHCKIHTAPYKYPRKIEFVTSLPKTISGKIRRVELRAHEWKK